MNCSTRDGHSGEYPARKQPAHLPVARLGFRSVVVFVTVCAESRKPIFTTEAVHHVLLSAWRRADAWSVGRYTIMPDHIHLFCAPATPDYPALGRWIQFWKALTSRQWPVPHQQPVWQRDHWDRQLRCGESYAAKWTYVRENPVRKHLVETADAWPYQGEMNVLWWHE